MPRLLIVGPWAIKFARGARGRRCNIYEANLFGTVDDRRRAMLCPVHWWSRRGEVLVMASARPLSAADHADLLETHGFPDWDYIPGEDGQPFEFKASDWGRLNGRLVALDYSTPAHDTLEEIAELRARPYGE
jgi:hypothetical protein